MNYFTADPHLGHWRIAENRGFGSVEEHDEVILSALNVPERADRIYLLGDFSFKRAQYYRHLIRCKHIHFIIGNHDRKTDSAQAFGQVHQQMVAKLDKGVKAFLSHYPTAYWPSSHHGAYHFYGHTHAMREETLDAMFPWRRSMDVGLDNYRRLHGTYGVFSQEQVLAHLRDRPGHDPVEWYADNFGSLSDAN